jgi:hypothetical protein
MCILCYSNVFTKPLPINDRGMHITDTGKWVGFMKYTVETDLGAMIYIPSFIQICSGIQKLKKGMLTAW